MLEELKELSFPGTKDAIIFVLQNIANHENLSVNDLCIICSHAPGRYQIALDALLLYCRCFGFIEIDGGLSVVPEIQSHISSPDCLNEYLVEKSIELLFNADIFQPNMFSFNITTQNFLFLNEKLPLAYASLRNILVSQDFFHVSHVSPKAIFNINGAYEKIVASFCKKHREKMTLQQLQKQLEKNAIAGDMAEKFVLEFERYRLGPHLGKRVKAISAIDVSAGYDLASFDTVHSIDYDRFIEVKAISAEDSFYWSSNEYDIAKLKGYRYYLYLVDLRRVGDEGYIPQIIQDPARTIMKSTEWLVESQSYHIRRIKL